MWNPSETIRLFKNRELDELYISIAVRNFALSIVAVFLPIYFLEQGMTLTWVFLFFAIKNLVHAACVLPVAHFCSRFGYKHGMVLSAPIIVLFFILLYLIDLTPLNLALLAAISGLQTALYYTGYHLDFSKLSKNTQSGRAAGMAKVISTIFHAAGPVLGGILLVLIGFKFTFLVVSVILVFSGIPLLLTKDGKVPLKHCKLSEIDPKFKREVVAFWGYGVQASGSQMLWPLFVYLTIVTSYTALGSIVSLGIIVSVFGAWIVGMLTDKHPRRVMRFGVIFSVLTWIGRLLVGTPAQVYAVDSAHGLATTTLTLPTEVISYTRANKTDIAGYIIMREIMIQLGRACIYILAAIAGLSLVTLGISGSGVLLFLFL